MKYEKGMNKIAALINPLINRGTVRAAFCCLRLSLFPHVVLFLHV